MKKFKRNAVVIAVLLFVSLAVFLNWSYNRSEAEFAAADASPKDEAPSETQNIEDGSEAEETGLYYKGDGLPAGVSEYFAAVRLNRSQARDSAVATLSNVSETEGASQDTIDSALEQIAEVAEDTMLEAELESLILAKGFEECVVFVNDGGIDITVPASGEGLSTADVAQITDIVLEETIYTTDDLKIIEVRN